jgi:hypothetical protein
MLDSSPHGRLFPPISGPTPPPPASPAGSNEAAALKSQLSYYRTAVAHLNTGQRNYWAFVWQPAVESAFKKIQDNRKWFYSLQGASTAAAVTVPALVGLNLSGTGGQVVRWLTFAVGLAGALTTATLTLFRFGSRWRLNREYYAELLQAGRNYALLGAPADGWTAFQQRVDGYIAAYDRSYDAEIISAAQPTGANKSEAHVPPQPEAAVEASPPTGEPATSPADVGS